MDGKVDTLLCQAGIQRDGTVLDSPYYVDGLWCRFQRGRPKKIKGFRQITALTSGISRGIHLETTAGVNTVFNGFSSGLEKVTMDMDGMFGGITSMTLGHFTSDSRNLWQFDSQFDITGNRMNIVAHPGQNLNDITNQNNTPVLYGDITGTALDQITDTASGGTPISVSGGVCVLHPYVFVYGNNGLIQNCTAGDITKWSGLSNPDANTQHVASGKVVYGAPLRGGSQAPAGLFWAIDSLIRVSFSGAGNSAYYWRYDTLSSKTSIMSSQCVVEYDGAYYWIGTDRFLMFNGTVTEIPNQQNTNWFFDNLNISQRQKVWGWKVPRFGEIWWFYPRGTATECTDAIIYNVRDKCWYDVGSAIGGQRSAGYYSQVFPFPIAADTSVFSGKASLWQHEVGADVIAGTSVTAIQSYIETNCLGWVTGGPNTPSPTGPNNWLNVTRVEPDFVQVGSMNVYVNGSDFAQTADVLSAPYSFTPTTGKVDLKEQRRQLRLRFESNTLGGSFEWGRILMNVELGDVRGAT